MVSLAVPEPTPAPPVDVRIISPTPEPFPTPIVNIPAVDPWAWSLDAVLSLLVGIGSLVAAAVAVGVTVYIARRDRSDRKGREAREARASVGAAMLTYVTAQLGPGYDRSAYTPLQQAIAASGLNLDRMESWLVDSAEALREWWNNAYPTGDVKRPKSTGATLAYLSAESLIRSPIVEWMTTGLEPELTRVPKMDDYAT